VIETANYTPGQAQKIQVKVNHPSQQRWGFELTARLASNPSQQAGSFAATGPNTAVGSINNIQYASHNNAPITATGAGFTFEVTWTPPATNVGDVIFYAAGNAANGNFQNTGDFIYTTNKTISPVAVTAQLPVINANGVVTALEFGGADKITAGSWIEIYGSNLASTTREWAGSDFNGNTAPTSLEGVSVTIGGRAAFVRFVSPTQINVQAPSGIGEGTGIPVVVTNANGSSAPAPILGQAVAPALYAPARFKTGNKQYPYAQSGTDVVGIPAGLFPGNTTRSARPGETITFYGTGFGPVETIVDQGQAPAQVLPGQIAPSPPTLTRMISNPVFRFGNQQATFSYAGLTPGAVGLYQFNVQVPAGLAPGEYQLIVTVGDQQIGYTIDVRP
jgi:uncharacterized protein (TIGR03437 family)